MTTKQVVCIKDYPELSTHKPIRKGQVLTIREKFLCPFSQRHGYRFFEITNAVNPLARQEFGYCCTYFKPVTKTDISVFTAMLNPSPATVCAYKVAQLTDYFRRVFQEAP